mgnify:FL=1
MPSKSSSPSYSRNFSNRSASSEKYNDADDTFYEKSNDDDISIYSLPELMTYVCIARKRVALELYPLTSAEFCLGRMRCIYLVGRALVQLSI